MNTLADQLVQEDIKREEQFKPKVLFLDLETGACHDEEVVKYRTSKIQEKYDKMQYNGAPSTWKDPVKIAKHKEDWHNKISGDIGKEISNIFTDAALDPNWNRIVCVAMGLDDKYLVASELEFSEKVLVQRICKTLEDVQTVVTYNGNGFDIPTLRHKCMKYGIAMPQFRHLDMMQLVGSYWGFGKKILIGQNDLAVSLGIKANQHDIDPSGIGAAFDNFMVNPDHYGPIIERIKQYNKEDVRQLKEIYERWLVFNGES